MKAFADLYSRLDATTSSNAKLAALRDYFFAASPEDAAWAVYFLAGGRPRQLVPSKLLRELTLTLAGLPPWLFEESYHAVGDLAETMALLLPQSSHTSEQGLATWVEDKLLPLRGLAPEVLTLQLTPLLQQLDQRSKLVCIKLITGSFRVGVSRLLVTRALAAVAGIDAKRIAQRLVGYTDLAARPTAADYLKLIAPVSDAGDERSEGQPYPFFLAHPLQQVTDELAAAIGSPEQWQVEWKWDGIRAQLVKRDGQLWLWSRGEELVTERFPELQVLAQSLPDGTVIDGELVVWKHATKPDVEVDPEQIKDQIGDQPTSQQTQGENQGQVQPFALLQQRIGRKTLTAKILQNLPVVILAYDLMEWQGEDWRQHPQSARREQLENIVAQCMQPQLQISPLLTGESWQALDLQRAASRSLGVEGFMLKRKDAQYGVGRTKDVGVWWKWKIEPYTADAVLIYAQTGHGRRASLYTDYTFAVWDSAEDDPERKLVPFAKAYSGLTDAEMREVDAIIRKTTVEKFGPVRSVTPTMVFELGFEGIALSGRHKSGIAVRFPRMLRWRQDKPVAEADTLQSLQALLPQASRSDSQDAV
ncbi:ATP-dependent DNA ligase [Methylophilus sp.]|uniref:ATP-dependent DNA ligase n=1 Tax=Methylophilus sp. TaxID=29541 RepID=UPI0040359DCC